MMFAESWTKFLAELEKGIRGLLPLVALVVYTLFGAWIFKTIEGPHEKFMLETLRREQLLLLENTTHNILNIRKMDAIPAKAYVEYNLLRYRESMGFKEAKLNNTKWDMWGAIYYSLCIYTTIGYGNIVPETPSGRVFTIVYAFIGIPLALLSLIALGRLLSKLCLALWTIFTHTFGLFSKNLKQKANFLDPERSMLSDTDDSEEDLLRFPLSFLLFITIGWVLFSAYLFLQWEEKWDFGTSLYFILISFTTIGFGDVITSQSDRIIVIGILLLVGLSLISTLIAIIQKQIEALASGVKGNIDKEYLKALMEAEEEAGDEKYFEDKNGIDHDQEKQQQGVPLLIRTKSKSPGALSLDTVVKRMPIRSRIIYAAMSKDKKRALDEHAQSKARLVNKGCQAVVKMKESGCQNVVDSKEGQCQTVILTKEMACQTDPITILEPQLKRTKSDISIKS